MLSGFKPQEIEDVEGARQAIVAVLNLVEELKQENQELRAENQRLRDEINRLKGEQGKPKIKADQSKAKDVSSEEERRTPKSWSKGRKLNKIVVHWEEKLSVDKSELPADAQFKGYEDAVVQDIRLEANNIRFVKEKYYSPSQQRTYLAPLPAGYAGEFGPGVRALVLTLYYASNMTEAKIAEFLGHIGVFISAGQISNVLIKNQDAWHGEKAAVWRAGLASSSWQHIDDTSTRVNGENQHCHVVCNPLYSAYFTRPAKERLTVIGLLQGGDSLNFLLTAQTPAWLDIFKTPLWVQRLIRTWPQNEWLTHAQMDALLARDAGSLNDQQQARILEAAALTAYHKQNHIPIVTTLISDDAAQFQHVTQRQALCWIHEGRHYKKLTPFVDHHRQLLEDFQTQFWDFYRELQGYQENPSPAQADRLRVEFGTLFRTTTGYQGLDQRIAKTLAKQDRLLEVLDQPQLPLHNNPAELAARQRVRKRDISFGPRTSDGVAAWDTFMTLSETAKKLGVNFYAYLHDRVSETYRMPTLATLIQQRSVSEQPQPASA